MESITDRQMEKYSSAVTLSDMEIFVFPELFYALLLANLMSPAIWEWRRDPWFEKAGKMSPRRRVDRLKQFIMDHYEFNLDLDTWGLTGKDVEMKRFAPFMDMETISRSNALFGYEGDKHYFDLDIRSHFGLEKYTTDTIPYWKTETVEAMNAFAHKENYRTGAGECVSFAALYAAALFIVGGIPLEDIFLMATPLHSQNFIVIGDGLLTNNRRIVTKNMWFNGTELTDKAQRALRHEQITMVMNNTGFVHSVYDEYTMEPAQYERFKGKMRDYLSTEISFEILANFLRQHSRFQKCFQICHEFHGKKRWIAAERAYAYEHGGPYKVSDATRDKLLEEIDREEFYCAPLPGRICLPKLEEFFKNNPIHHYDAANMAKLGENLKCASEQKDEMLAALAAFVHLEPEFPSAENKTSAPWAKLEIDAGMTREQIISYLETMRDKNAAADLAFYALRDMSRTNWTPFLKAAVERNPVSIDATKTLTDEQLIAAVQNLNPESIYDAQRLAQPDEVWNFQTGDGIEKAILLANIWKHRHPETCIQLTVQPDRAELRLNSRTIAFQSTKNLTGVFK